MLKTTNDFQEPAMYRKSALYRKWSRRSINVPEELTESTAAGIWRDFHCRLFSLRLETSKKDEEGKSTSQRSSSTTWLVRANQRAPVGRDAWIVAVGTHQLLIVSVLFLDNCRHWLISFLPFSGSNYAMYRKVLLHSHLVSPSLISHRKGLYRSHTLVSFDVQFF